jgi:hypothetical protein
MAETATSSALVIGGRYLASPAALRARPDGPLDALDTQSGRAAQVRIVFASDGWDDDTFAEAVSRWCALASSEICGVLDFGLHEGRRFLVVAPSLGMTIERWQLTRRPAAADAARLTLAFGRLAERIAAAGFPVDACELGDCAVGPGPTPFLERPLLGAPSVNSSLVGPRDGQRTLAAILRAAGGGPLPEPLERWTAQAAAAGFDSLAACLDELEARGNDVRAVDGDEQLVSMESLFDEDDDAFEARLLAPAPRTWPRRLLGGLGALAIAALAVAALSHRGTDAPPVATGPAPARPVAITPRTPAPVHHRHHQRAMHVSRRRHVDRHRPHRRAPEPQAPPPAAGDTSTPAAPPAPGATGTSLPDPGSPSTLPAPR